MTSVLVIAGPTAVGKSSLAHRVALAVGAEIVSADSRQVYRGLDIGTAKPTSRERAEVPYHGLDSLLQGVRWSAGQFLGWVTKTITEIQGRGRPVVVVGGSTLYVHALTQGLADLPAVPRDLESELLALAGTEAGRATLYSELATADPEAARSLDPTKTHRLVRWVGLWRSTGRPPSAYWREPVVSAVPSRLVVLTRPREQLYRRINARVVQMMDDGLLAEARALLAAAPPARATLEATIGYRELLPVLDGDGDLDEAVRLIQRNTRRYAKRQLTWYRRYEDATWLDASATPDELLRAASPWPASG